MLRLWRIEWRKLKSYIVFWVMIGLYVAFLSLVLLSIRGSLNDTLGSASESIPFFAFPYVWQNMTWFASFFNPILVMIMIIIVCNEYSYRTARQNIIDGLSRSEFLMSKALVALVISIMTTILIFFLILFVALSANRSTENFTENIEFVFVFALQLFGYLSFGILVSVLLRRTGFAIVLFLIYYAMIEPIAYYSLLAIELPFPLQNYLPLRAIGDIVVSPLPQSVTNFQNRITELQISKIIIGVIYIIIFWGGSFFFLNKRDL